MSKKLYLFDIDGTLLSTHGIPRIAMGNVLNRIYQDFDYHENYSFSGRTDWEIIAHLLEFSGRAAKDELIHRIMRDFADELQIQLQNGKKPLVFAGVREILNYLSNIPHAYLGLVTGNIQAGAEIKLTAAGLNNYFEIGGFGDDARHRSDLPPIAMHRAEEHFGIKFSAENTWIIGDSEHDISCAKDNNLRSLAVSTGWTQYDTLRAQEPDFLVSDFSDVSQITQILLEK